MIYHISDPEHPGWQVSGHPLEQRPCNSSLRSVAGRRRASVAVALRGVLWNTNADLRSALAQEDMGETGTCATRWGLLRTRHADNTSLVSCMSLFPDKASRL